MSYPAKGNDQMLPYWKYEGSRIRQRWAKFTLIPFLIFVIFAFVNIYDHIIKDFFLVGDVNLGFYINAVDWSVDDRHIISLGKSGSVVSVFDSSNLNKISEFSRDSSAYASNSFGVIYNNSIIVVPSYGEGFDVNGYNVIHKYPTSTNLLLSSVNYINGNILVYLPDYSSDVIYSERIGGRPDVFSVSHDKKKIAVAVGKKVYIFDLCSKSGVTQLYIDEKINMWFPRSLSFSYDDNEIAIGTSSGKIIKIDVLTGNINDVVVAFPPIDGNYFSCLSIEYSRDGKMLAVGASNIPYENANNIESIRIFSNIENKFILSVAGSKVSLGGRNQSSRINSMSWGADGNLAVGDNVSVRVLNILHGVYFEIINKKLSDGAYKVKFSNDGNKLAVASGKSVYLLNFKNAER